MKQFPFTFMRGGTSKAVFFREKDMPQDRDKWTDFLLDVMGSPDTRQIDGMGGANSLTSKVAIIGNSQRPDADVDYTFAQVSLTASTVDFKGNCGNISSAVAPYAIHEGLFPASDGTAMVRVYNTNTDKIIVSELQVHNGVPVEEGSCHIPGVPGQASPIYLSFFRPQGAVTGKLLPTGNAVDTIQTSKGEVNISIVDAANPLVYMYAEEVGVSGVSMPSDFTHEQLEYIEEIRSIAAELCGFAAAKDATAQSPAVPKATLISAPSDYSSMENDHCTRADMDIVVRMMSMQKPHQALAITGAICITTAAATPGTIVQTLVKKDNPEDNLRIAHPGGIMECVPSIKNGDLHAVKVVRTARRLATGNLYTKHNY